MDDEAFAELAVADARKEATPEQSALLREPENVERWHATLVRLKQGVETQFTERKADLAEFRNECMRSRGGKQAFFEAKAEHEEWRGNAARFKAGIEVRMREAKTMIRGLYGSRKAAPWDEMVELLREIRDLLRAAVGDHKEERP